MQATERLLLAGFMRQHVKQAYGLAQGAMDLGLDLVPVLGTARMGARAFKDFGKGRWLSGAGNLIGAGLSVIPGGGLAAGAGRLAAKGLSRIAAPTLAKGIGAGSKMLGNAMVGAGQGAGRAMTSIGSKIPGLFSAPIARPMAATGKFMARHPYAAGAVGMTGLQGGQSAVTGAQQAAKMQVQQRGQMDTMLENMRRSPVMTNPMYAGWRG